MFWDEKIECMSQEDMEELQLKRLQDVVKTAFNKVPYYHKRYTEEEVYPEDIETLADIEKLPFTTKTDLRASYPFGLFAVPQKDIIEIHTSSGTTGKPTVSGYTEEDLDIWGELIARGFTMMGVDENDIIQNTHGYGLFTGGFGVHYGGQKIGATVVPISTGQTLRQIELMKDFQSTMLIFTPSYGLHIAEELKAMGITPDDLNLKVIGFGSE
ncbi:MAG TPA: phenylacetate--CoA ligase, partial [Methanosphaera sp.]|nr:phenylacetate--CoA ligase [Methanosphaera sp.]